MSDGKPVLPDQGNISYIAAKFREACNKVDASTIDTMIALIIAKATERVMCEDKEAFDTLWKLAEQSCIVFNGKDTPEDLKASSAFRSALKKAEARFGQQVDPTEQMPKPPEDPAS